jgi:acyl-[acyl-carrier-protein]-phospholipid O-acyltransferase / long-chain-fatty-acid--[acyl-carrier-protein] ligase
MGKVMAWLSASMRSLAPFFLVRPLLRLCCRVEVRGRENIPPAGKRVLIVANHVSSLDALILSAFLPGRILFAAPSGIFGRWWLKPYWRRRYTLDETNSKTARTMIDALKKGRRCMIFPEGRPNRAGGLMKVYESPGMIADKSDALILPIRIDGPQYSRFSEQRGDVRRRLFPRIVLGILPAVTLDLPKEVKGRQRRQLAGARLHDLMEKTLVAGTPISTMLRQLLWTRTRRGGGGVLVTDASREPVTHDDFVAGVFALARALKRAVGGNEKSIGIMMPNGIPNAKAIFAVQALGRVSAMMNYTAGPLRIVQACKMAEIETVVTQREVVAILHLEPTIEALERENIKVLHYEDLAARTSFRDRLAGRIRARLPPRLAARGLPENADGPALLLFTSGTEGMPKGVMLSHRNVVANGVQFAVRIGYGPSDSVFACLPMFHSFGLTLGFFMPLFTGTRTFLFPSPLRYHDVPEYVYDSGASLLLGTDTFLANYARSAAPHDFYFLRYAIGGAEKIKPETRQVWAEKFGVRLFEGYGTTEASPVISCNSPLHYKAGTVGRALSCLDAKLKPVEGIANGAELMVRGINVMLGYVMPDKPGAVQPLRDGWYDTGDIVSLDEEGYITILGRTKRFAKIGGEMVSLGAIEAVVNALWPESRHVAVGIPGDRKGETVVLLTESDKVDLSALLAHFTAAGLSKLSLPRKLVRLPKIPLLGSGKTDYAGARDAALAAEDSKSEKT